MSKNITVIGAGSTGHAAAAYFSLKGLHVCLLEYEPCLAHRLADIEDCGGILLRGKERGFATEVWVSKNPSEVIPKTDVIFVCVVAHRHQQVAQAIGPYLRDGQHIVISPGNLGSFIFRQALREGNGSATVTVSELEGNLFPARLTGKAEATVGMPFGKKSFASLPKRDMPAVMAALDGIVGLLPCENVMDCAINSNNFVTHLGASLLSATAIEHRGRAFNLFTDGLTPGTVELARLASEERRRIIGALGLKEHSDPMLHLNRLLDMENNPQLDVFITLDGPYSLDHRYFTEDATCCCAFAVSLAHKLGIAVPVLESILALTGALNGTDYLKTGRTLENLGFGGQTAQEMLASL